MVHQVTGTLSFPASPQRLCGPALQSRAAHFKQKQLQDEAQNGAPAAAGGYAGPDGSGQWISLGELGHNAGDLDAALNDIATGAQQ